MSAPTINAAMPPSTGPAPGSGAAASAAQATGPLAGFEALLAAFFGAQGDLAIAAQAGQAATAKSGGTTGALVIDGSDASGDAAAPAATDDTSTPTADAAAAQAACNAALILPVAGQPTAAAPTTTVDTTAAEGAAQAMAPAKSFTPMFGPAPKAQPVSGDAAGAAADASGAPGAAIDPNAAVAAPAVKTAKLDPAAAPPLNAPQPTAATAPLQAPAPAAAPAAAPAPEAPVEAPAPAAVAQALTAPQAAVEARPAGQTAPAQPAQTSSKAPAPKAGRGEHARIDIAAPDQAKSPSATLAATDVAANAAGGDDTIHALKAGPAAAEAKPEAQEAPTGSADAGAATASTTNATTQVHPGAIPVRGAPQTVANLAAQIAKKLEGRSTRFDVQLDPAGLGRVDVRMEIGASGRMTAAMTFDTPQAAAELRARAAELQRHLEQAGFDMSGGLSFDVAGDRGQGRQAPQNQDNDSGQAFRGRAFQQALATAGQADQSAASGALNLRRSLLSGVDIRI